MPMKHSLHNILVVARNTYRETVRDKILYVIVAFAAVYSVFAWFLSTIALGENLHVMRSLGLAGIYFFGLLVTIFLGTSLVYKEIERRTLYFLLSKPISHLEVVVGKFLGLLSSVTVSVLGMTAVYLALVAYTGGGFDKLALVAVLFELFELAVVVAMSVFFSTYARPLAGVVYTVLLVYIGHSLHLLLDLVHKSGPLMQGFMHGVYYVMPNLEKFNVRDAALYGFHPNMAATAFAALYALV